MPPVGEKGKLGWVVAAKSQPQRSPWKGSRGLGSRVTVNPDLDDPGDQKESLQAGLGKGQAGSKEPAIPKNAMGRGPGVFNRDSHSPWQGSRPLREEARKPPTTPSPRCLCSWKGGPKSFSDLSQEGHSPVGIK